MVAELAYGAIILLGVSFSLSARHAVCGLSDGTVRLPLPWLFAAGIGPAALFLASGGLAVEFHGLLLAIGVLLMMLLALTDLRSAWAPDRLVYPLLAITVLFAVEGSTLKVGMAVLACLAVYWLLQRSFSWVNEKLGYCPPPVDLLAFAIGPALLGFTTAYALAMVLSFALLLLLRQAPALTRCIMDESVLAEAASDLRYTNEMGHPIPLLAILFPSYTLAILLAAFNLVSF